MNVSGLRWSGSWYGDYRFVLAEGQPGSMKGFAHIRPKDRGWEVRFTPLSGVTHDGPSQVFQLDGVTEAEAKAYVVATIALEGKPRGTN
jgi:hypothetical protein